MERIPEEKYLILEKVINIFIPSYKV